MTGLAFVFVMVLLGTVIIRSGEDPVSNAAANNVVEAPSDPLGELGVAPGPGTENEAGAAPQR